MADLRLQIWAQALEAEIGNSRAGMALPVGPDSAPQDIDRSFGCARMDGRVTFERFRPKTTKTTPREPHRRSVAKGMKVIRKAVKNMCDYCLRWRDGGRDSARAGCELGRFQTSGGTPLPLWAGGVLLSRYYCSTLSRSAALTPDWSGLRSLSPALSHGERGPTFSRGDRGLADMMTDAVAGFYL
jgi:hypothetical protein